MTSDPGVDEAMNVLRRTAGFHVGASIPVDTDPVVRQWMIDRDLIGKAGGLTIRGSCLAERIQLAHLDELFG